MGILVTLPLIAFLLFYAALRQNGHEWRAAALIAGTFWGMAVTLITEILSLWNGVAVAWLAAAWLLVIALAARFLYPAMGGPKANEPLLVVCRKAVSHWDRVDIALVLGVGLIVGLVGVTAILYPPNTTDAMTYHLPRIVHWLRNRSVAFYPTHDLRQLSLQPWAEYAMLQLHALVGGDWFDSLVQWFSMTGCVIGVSLIAKMVGATPGGQVLAALFCATIPEGILEASGAKNDYSLCFWLVCLVYYLLAFRRAGTLGNALGIGGALGLACLTKGSAFVFAPPLIVALALLWPHREWRRYVRYFLFAGGLFLVLNAPVFVRCYRFFGSPLGPSAYAPPKGLKLTNDTFGLGVTAWNVMRNMALHMEVPNPAMRQGLEARINESGSLLGLEVNDPRLTWDRTEFHLPESYRHEALAANPWHMLLILATILVLCWRARSGEYRDAAVLACGLSAAFVLFCAVFKWQPWNTRLHLPLFVLWAAVAGSVLVRSWPRAATVGLAALLLLLAKPNVFGNVLRPLTFAALEQSRQEAYFNDRGDLRAPYIDAVKLARSQQCGDIGLNLPMNAFEYPLLVLLDDQTGTRKVRDVEIANNSKQYAGEESNSPPCVVICTECAVRVPAWNQYKSRFAWARDISGITVLGTRPAADTDECSVTFAGWHELEKGGSEWWRWSSGAGEVHIFVSRDRDVFLDGGVSFIAPPNRVDVLFNGVSQAKVETATPAAALFQGLLLHLRQGDNAVQFVSQKPGIHIPSDARVLAFSIRNLQIRTSNGVACVIR